MRVAVEGDRRLGFYERVGFVTTGEAATRFGNAPRMTLEFEAS